MMLALVFPPPPPPIVEPAEQPLSKNQRRKQRQRELADIDPEGDIIQPELLGHRYVEYRQRLLKRNPVCVFCGCKLTEATATLDHARPRSLGGLNTPGNLWLSCGDCNRFKGSRTPIEWLQQIHRACVTMGVIEDDDDPDDPDEDDDDWTDAGTTG